MGGRCRQVAEDEHPTGSEHIGDAAKNRAAHQRQQGEQTHEVTERHRIHAVLLEQELQEEHEHLQNELTSENGGQLNSYDGCINDLVA